MPTLPLSLQLATPRSWGRGGKSPVEASHMQCTLHLPSPCFLMSALLSFSKKSPLSTKEVWGTGTALHP